MLALPDWLNWFFRDNAGRVVIAQWPNLWLWLFGATWLVSRLAGDRVAHWAAIASSVLLAIWAADEALRGVNPWRRCLGAAVLLWLFAGLFGFGQT